MINHYPTIGEVLLALLHAEIRIALAENHAIAAENRATRAELILTETLTAEIHRAERTRLRWDTVRGYDTPRVIR